MRWILHTWLERSRYMARKVGPLRSRQLFIHSFIHSFNRHISGTCYYMPDTVLDAEGQPSKKMVITEWGITGAWNRDTQCSLGVGRRVHG